LWGECHSAAGWGIPATSIILAIIIIITGIIIITKELIKVMPSQLQTVKEALYNTLSPVTHQGMTAEKVIV